MKKFDFPKGFGDIDPKYISEAEGEWKGKKNTWTPSFWRKLAAACVILVLISTVLSNPKVQAAIKEVVLSIGQTLGFQRGIDSYTEVLNTIETDNGITTKLKEVVLDEGILLFEIHAEIDDSEADQQGKSAPISSFTNTGISLDTNKTTINGQKLDKYEGGDYSPYAKEVFDTDPDIDETEYNRVKEYRFHAPRDLGENPEIHLVLQAFDVDDWEKTIAEFTFDFTMSREEILKQTTDKELENISVQTEEGPVILKNIFLNKLQSSISAEIPEKLYRNYEVELRGKDSKGNKVRYDLMDDAKTEDINRDWKFKTEFWTFNADERPELPDPDSEYVELQLYLKSENSSENSVTKEYVVDDDDDVYIEEESNVYDMEEEYDSGWEAVGEKIRIDIR